jgi:hypothetical protein
MIIKIVGDIQKENALNIFKAIKDKIPFEIK